MKKLKIVSNAYFLLNRVIQESTFSEYLKDNLTQEKNMPRLVGKQSKNEVLAGFILVLVLGAAFVSAEYYGYTNFIQEWGTEKNAKNSNAKIDFALTSPVKN